MALCALMLTLFAFVWTCNGIIQKTFCSIFITPYIQICNATLTAPLSQSGHKLSKEECKATKQH
jgi:hypothetical protein